MSWREPGRPSDSRQVVSSKTKHIFHIQSPWFSIQFLTGEEGITGWTDISSSSSSSSSLHPSLDHHQQECFVTTQGLSLFPQASSCCLILSATLITLFRLYCIHPDTSCSHDEEIQGQEVEGKGINSDLHPLLQRHQRREGRRLKAHTIYILGFQDHPHHQDHYQSL